MALVSGSSIDDGLILVFLIFFFLVDLEVAQVVGVFVGGDDSQPITEVVLLKVFLGEVFQIPVCGRREDTHNDNNIKHYEHSSRNLSFSPQLYKIGFPYFVNILV